VDPPNTRDPQFGIWGVRATALASRPHHTKVLNGLGVTPFYFRRQFHIIAEFRNTLFRFYLNKS